MVRITMKPPKLSTAGAMAFGAHASRNVVDVDPTAAEIYQARRAIDPERTRPAQCNPTGRVIVRHRGAALGIGVRRDDGRIDSHFPKGWLQPE